MALMPCGRTTAARGRATARRIVALAATSAFMAAGATGTATAASGDLDTSFGAGGRLTTPFEVPATSGAAAVARQADGRLVVAGSGFGSGVVARLQADGSLDPTFSGDGRTGLRDVWTLADVAVQPDGRIVAVGTLEGPDGVDIAVVRLSADGSRDPSFAGDGMQSVDFGGNDFGNAIAVQPDGRILVAGDGGDTSNEMVLARLEPDGALDASFSEDGRARTAFGPFFGAKDLALQPDGRIVLVGSGREEGVGSPDLAVARFRADGTLDPSFDGDGRQAVDGGGPSNEGALAVDVQADGRIVLAGERSTDMYNSNATDVVVARLLADGAPDVAFAGDGIFHADFGGAASALDVRVREDGRVVLAGRGDAAPADGRADPLVARLDAAGALDASFSGDGSAFVPLGGTGQMEALAFDGDDRTIAVGSGGASEDREDVVALRLTDAGAADVSFGTDGRVAVPFRGESWAVTVAAADDGDVLAVGTAWSDVAVARYDADGRLDPAFSEDGRAIVDLGSFDLVHAAAVGPDGRIVVAGSSAGDVVVARLLPDGTLDPAFSGDGKTAIDTGVTDERALGVVLLPGGGVVAVGERRGDVDEPSDVLVVQLRADGTPDAGFSGDGKATIDLGGEDQASAVIRRADGQLVLAGRSDDSAAVVQLLADGTPDVGFDGDGVRMLNFGPSSGFGAQAAALARDGGVLVAAAGDTDFVVAKLTADGSLDGSFAGDGTRATDFGGADVPRSLLVAPDGAVVVGGSSSGDFALARLRPDGVLDASFSGDGRTTLDFDGAYDGVLALGLQPDGKLLAGGLATTEVGDLALARFHGSGGSVAPSDSVPPAIEIATPADGQRFARGQVVDAVFSCADPGGSGVRSCEGPARVDTSASGEATFTVTATDVAGNRASRSVRYVVEERIEGAGGEPQPDGGDAHQHPAPTGPAPSDDRGTVPGPTPASAPPIVLRAPSSATTAVLRRGMPLRVTGTRPRSAVVLRIRRGSRSLAVTRTRSRADGSVLLRAKLPKALARRLRRGTRLTLVLSTIDSDGDRVTRRRVIRVR